MISLNKPEWDCIVVGAGMSGLCCASRLAQRGHRVLILEARDRIGGRIHTVYGPDKEPVDLGARCVKRLLHEYTLTKPEFLSFVHGVDGNPLTRMAEENKVVSASYLCSR
jgi:monoamine oxidase